MHVTKILIYTVWTTVLGPTLKHGAVIGWLSLQQGSLGNSFLLNILQSVISGIAKSKPLLALTSAPKLYVGSFMAWISSRSSRSNVLVAQYFCSCKCAFGVQKVSHTSNHTNVNHPKTLKCTALHSILKYDMLKLKKSKVF